MVLRVVLSNIRKNIILAPDSFWHQVTGSKLLKEPHGWAGCHTQEKEASKILACVTRLRRTRELAQMQALRKTVPEDYPVSLSGSFLSYPGKVIRSGLSGYPGTRTI